MEVEIKLRLASREAHDRVAAALSAAHQATHQQENFFFDGSRQELTSSQSVLRCRFYNTDKRALLTCKGKQELVGGIGRGTELETDIDPIKARELLQHPDGLLQLKIDFVDNLCSKLGVQSLVSLGGFKNVRQDFSWEGFKLELDETQFDWGTVYEIEVETEEPEQLKSKLEAFLKQHNVEYKYSTVTKFHNFVSKTLD